jgi:hypothetical protein
LVPHFAGYSRNVMKVALQSLGPNEAWEDAVRRSCAVEEEKRVHSLSCRRCVISVRLKEFKAQILKVLRDIDFVMGDPDEKNRRSGLSWSLG